MKILPHKEKAYTPWTEKCQFLLVALYNNFLNLEKDRLLKGRGFISKRVRYKCTKIFSLKENV